MRKYSSNTRLPHPGLEKFKAEVEERAKEIFLKRNEAKGPGDALSDWLQAEKEIQAKYRMS